MMARWSYLQGNGCFGALRLLQWRHKAHAQGPRHQATCMYDENLTVKQGISFPHPQLWDVRICKCA